VKVVDLFCGCGGFSLGFEYAGFDIIYGLDNWEVACMSFAENFPKAEVVCENALDLTADDIPDADVIIGGPPCQQFSIANLKKRYDTSLVEWFWKIVEEKDPKYVIMEEVPLVERFLPSELFRERGYKCKVYRMCDYGVPQIRRRLFAGRFEEPEKSPTNIVFPAVLATEYKGASRNRQVQRLGWVFNRKSLIPEAKIVQTFPLDYVLCGTTKEQYIQIGNAVPPLMAYRLAEAIMRKESGDLSRWF